MISPWLSVRWALWAIPSRLSDKWTNAKCITANRLATHRCRVRAGMWGHVFALTGQYGTGWPGRYLSEFAAGEADASEQGSP